MKEYFNKLSLLQRFAQIYACLSINSLQSFRTLTNLLVLFFIQNKTSNRLPSEWVGYPAAAPCMAGRAGAGWCSLHWCRSLLYSLLRPEGEIIWLAWLRGTDILVLYTSGPRGLCWLLPDGGCIGGLLYHLHLITKRCLRHTSTSVGEVVNITRMESSNIHWHCPPACGAWALIVGRGKVCAGTKLCCVIAC